MTILPTTRDALSATMLACADIGIAAFFEKQRPTWADGA